MPPVSPRPAQPLDQDERTPALDREGAWIVAARAGDRQAFGRLVGAYDGLVYRVIGRLIADPDDRDDLVQETFFRALEALPSFRPGAAFRPWLLSIALNAARDLLRSRRRWEGMSLDDPAAGTDEARGLMDGAARPDEQAAAGELQDRIEAAFERLDGQARTILWLRVREELSYGEMSAVLGIPLGTVMSRLSRARHALRASLAGHGVTGAARGDRHER